MSVSIRQIPALSALVARVTSARGVIPTQCGGAKGFRCAGSSIGIISVRKESRLNMSTALPSGVQLGKPRPSEGIVKPERAAPARVIILITSFAGVSLTRASFEPSGENRTRFNAERPPSNKIVGFLPALRSQIAFVPDRLERKAIV